MWTKGNDKGEWEVITDEDHVVVDVHTEHHLNCDVSDFCCEDLLSVKFDNPHDERLFQLAPRMAEELLGQYTKNGNKWDSIHCGYYCECPEERNDLDDLLDELYKMKHGAE